MIKNFMEIKFASCSSNESFARIAVAAFVSQLDPTLEELTDIKTVISEAVTNVIIHAYEDTIPGMVHISVAIDNEEISITVSDTGIGIADVERARQPMYTSKVDFEHAGMGFAIMEHFMDNITVSSETNKGTVIHMVKRLKASNKVAVVN
uniref:Anti-sigma F factor n=2 Tax=Pasteuria ramosa TaxID=225322 RepID=Q1KT21_9BACL|nr:SpoIIAB [Pasteuria ramosa]